jgi:hypothetical protein
MREDLLHHLWKFRNFSSQVHYSSTGQQVEVIHPGIHNHDSGPDFFNARIRIDNIVWAGNVELHVKSSDWVAHGHCSDRAYDNVILHVVYNDDKPEKLIDAAFSTLEIRKDMDPRVVDKYDALIQHQTFVPCAQLLDSSIVRSMLINTYLDRLFVEKLEHKCNLILDLLSASNGNWERTLYTLVARSFGLGANRLPFELLLTSIPSSLIIRDLQNIEQVEALLFGQAGFLSGVPVDEYSTNLKAHYDKLRPAFQLYATSEHLWKFSRLRPGNFPTLRIAQLAAFLYQDPILFKDIMQTKDLRCLVEWFRVEASDYWAVHSKFGRSSVKRSIRIGNTTIDSVIINAVLPTMFAYGKVMHEPELVERSIELMRELCGETNKIVSAWQKLGFSIDSALKSQALLHLKKAYCDHKKCLSCTIGTAILKQGT